MANSIQVTVRGELPQFDQDKYMAAYVTHLDLIFHEAVRQFLRRIILDDAVRIDTGMSRSSLLPLARAVKAATDVESSIIPERRPRKGLTLRSGGYVANRFTGPDEGESAGKNAYDLILGNIQNPVFLFRFRINVFQWRYWEDAWSALEKGRAAFNEHIRVTHKAPPLTAGFLSGRKI